MGKDKRILVYPGWQESNYYQSLYQNDTSIEYTQYDGAVFPLLRNYKLHKKPDIIHLHWLTAYFAVDVPWSLNFAFRYFISLVDIIILKAFTDVKIAWTVHNLYEHETKHHILERLAKIVISKVVDTIFVLGPTAKPMIEKMYRANSDKIVISAHGDFNHIFPNVELDKNACRDQLKLPKDKRMYLFPGTVKPYKGINYLISTFKEWNNPSAVLVVAGKVSRSMEESLGELPANVIVHNKFIPDNELPSYFHAADWTVVPYQRILSSATILTAMGMGSAIIAPEMGILPDYCDDKGGILYNSNEKNALQSTLEKSLNLPAETMGDYNKQKVKKFDWKEISTDTINVLKNL